MFPIDRLIQLTLCLLVLVGGSLLGISLGRYDLVVITLVAGIAGYWVTDRLKWFKLDGLLANIASIVVLILAMYNFFPEDSTGKLVSVANLLIYLQVLLMFQVKTPRLIWQILLLSLLEGVVAAIFSLNLEGGVLFLAYFVLAGATLVMQLFFRNNREIEQMNQQSARLAARELERLGKSEQSEQWEKPFVFFDPEPRNLKGLRPVFRHLGMWMAIAVCFTVVMFYIVPRNTTPWLGGAKYEIAMASPAKSVDLLNRGQIQQSNQLIFRVRFFDERDESIKPPESLYFRGIALSNLVMENGHTNWTAPFDRVSESSYQGLYAIKEGANRIRQLISMEENRHPLVYLTMPYLPLPETPDGFTFCHELSAITRCNLDSPVELAPYKFEISTLTDSRGQALDSWPYFTYTRPITNLPMKADPSEYEWLTKHDPERYPSIVAMGNRIVAEARKANPGANQRDICEAIEEFFLQRGGFSYTLDYSKVVRNEKLDPNEDFVRNHRSGHCEMFASAMVLMLRSQNIPARLVTGFYGGDPSTLTGELMVRGIHAHAWVEAYLAPEDCSEEMQNSGGAGPGGAWLRLDPTPPTSRQSTTGVGTEAIDLARTFWQDYVLGMNSEMGTANQGEFNSQLISFFQRFQFDGWEDSIFKLDGSLKSKGFRNLMIALMVFPPLITWLIAVVANYRAVSKGAEPIRFRDWLGKAIRLLSPGLGNWVMAKNRGTAPNTQFYDRMVNILKERRLVRSQSQSQREFARIVEQHFSSHPQAGFISSTVSEVSEIFYEIRFGRRKLSPDLEEQIHLCLDELESGIRT